MLIELDKAKQIINDGGSLDDIDKSDLIPQCGDCRFFTPKGDIYGVKYDYCHVWGGKITASPDGFCVHGAHKND